MAVEVHEEVRGKVVRIDLTGKLTKDDYAHFVPGLERVIQEHGKIRLLVTMKDAVRPLGGTSTI